MTLLTHKGVKFEWIEECEKIFKEDGTLWCKARLCVPDNKELKKKIMNEAHSTPFTAHPGSTKMYQDMKGTIGGQT